MTDMLVEPVTAQQQDTRRFFHIRDVDWSESTSGHDDYIFVGFAAVFNTWSELLWTPKGTFREQFIPGCFDDVLNRGEYDTRLLINHDKNKVLARSKSGTLELSEEEDGLRVWARVAKTSYANDLKISMERGDLDQMSLMFEMDYDNGAVSRWYEDKKVGEVRHEVVKVSDVFDVSVVTFPAYAETTAVMRDLERAQERGMLTPALMGAGAEESEGAVVKAEPTRVVVKGERQFSKRAYARCRQVIAETPWAIHPPYLNLIMAIMEERLIHGRPTDEEIQERIGVRRDNEPTMDTGVAVIPLVGPILSRAGAMQQVSGAKSLDDFKAEFRQALNDPAVSSIVIDIDSPGGTVDGVPEMAQEIYAARGKKPIKGVSNYMAASAAYWIGSACDELICSPSAEVGSVGVYAAHQDRSAEMEMKGVKTTYISAGEFKTELNPFTPLSEEAMGYVQGQVDSIYKDFVGAVAKQRGVTRAEVESNFGQGRMKQAREAVKAGMADRVATIDQVINELNGNVHSREMDGFVSVVEARDYLMLPGHIMGDEPEVDLSAAAIPYVKTDVVDKPWDAGANVRRCKAAEPQLRSLHAWVDSAADKNLKGSYKFPHHEVGGDGNPGAANVNGVRNGLARLTGSKIPEADKPGVQRHLQRHLDDFHGSQAQAEAQEPMYWTLDRESMVETRDAAVEYLGIGSFGGPDFAAQAEIDPVGNRSGAQAEIDPAVPGQGKGAQAETDPVVGAESPAAKLKARTRAETQKAREEHIRFVKESSRG